MQPPNYGPDPTSPHTTFVQADPTNFRSIVQKLTGASDDPSSPKLPLTLPSRATHKIPSSSSSAGGAAGTPPATITDMGPRKPPFKLHERRHRKLEQIQLSNSNRPVMAYLSPSSSAYYSTSPSHLGGGRRGQYGGGCSGEMTVMVSPVSPLDLFTGMSPASSGAGQQSPLLCLSPSEKEERAIAEKGFYLHPSPLSTPRVAEPQLLPLFPLHSPRDDDHDQRRS